MVSRLLNYLKSIIWAKKETDAVDDKAFRRIDGKKSCVFAVDGGNALICDGGTWSISKIKTVAVGYEDGRRIKEEIVFNCFVLIRKDGDIQFDEEIQIPTFDFKNIKFEDVPSEVRKILEYMTAVKVIDGLKANDVLMLDSLLKPDYSFQENILNELMQKAKEKGIHLIGIAKTSRLATKSGRSLVGLLNEVGKKGFPWYYYPISDDRTIFKDIVARFHQMSSYCYRCNLLGDMTALATAAFYSNDPEILGYPYPLLRADKVARITSHERDAERRNLSITAKRMGLDNIEYDILSHDMHEKIDRRMYR